MLTDAHCHPYDCLKLDTHAFEDPSGFCFAASAWNQEQFEYHEGLRRTNTGAGTVLCCFAVHPQLAALKDPPAHPVMELLSYLAALAKTGRLDAIGETGFDLFDAPLRATEAVQEQLFAAHLEAAIAHGLPLVLHVRKAMHKIFAYTPLLKQVPALIFHSYSGTLEDAQALLKRGLNAYFSFGNSILLNHKAAQRACAAVPLTRLLSETDSPYQPLRGNRYSSWQDLPLVLRMMADLRAQAAVPQKIEYIIEENFFAAFHKTLTTHG